ncbi:MAG TPA: tripartite tricarboxylate transporter substrate binding protein [Xanthobacteraceae bacterium]|nr:tripartite tricarboxylate transporter substrate binding protein [Xanthobacteraceae bacterium]
MRANRRHILALAGAAVAMPCMPRLGPAQAYPSRPVRLIVPVAAGGANDTTARLFAQKLSESLGQQFYVENVPGAGGNLGIANAARAPADGYTLLAGGGNFVINPSLYAKIPFDPVKDFAAVSLMCSSPHVLAVHPSVPAATIKEFIALVQTSPGTLSYGSAGRGTPAHLAGEMFKLAFGLDLIHVPFTGGGPAITSTLGGHTPVIMSALPTGAPYAKAGNVRALAMMSAKRSSVLPDVPTMGEATGTELEADIVTGLVAPAGTPREIIELLHRTVAKIIAPPEFKERLLALGFEPVASTPEHFSEWLKIEIAKWAKVIRDGSIGVQ